LLERYLATGIVWRLPTTLNVWLPGDPDAALQRTASVIQLLEKRKLSPKNARKFSFFSLAAFEKFEPILAALEQDIKSLEICHVPKIDKIFSDEIANFKYESIESLSVHPPIFIWERFPDRMPRLKSVYLSSTASLRYLTADNGANFPGLESIAVSFPHGDVSLLLPIHDLVLNLIQLRKASLKHVALYNSRPYDLAQILFDANFASPDADFVAAFEKRIGIGMDKISVDGRSLWFLFWSTRRQDSSPPVGAASRLYAILCRPDAPSTVQMSYLEALINSGLVRKKMTSEQAGWAVEMFKTKVLADKCLVEQSPQSIIRLLMIFSEAILISTAMEADDVISEVTALLRSFLHRNPELLAPAVASFSSYNIQNGRTMALLFSDVEFCRAAKFDFAARPFADGVGWLKFCEQSPQVLKELVRNPGISLAWSPLTHCAAFLLDSSPDRYTAVRNIIQRHKTELNGKETFLKALGDLDQYAIAGLLGNPQVARDVAYFFGSDMDALLASKYARKLIYENRGRFLSMLEQTCIDMVSTGNVANLPMTGNWKETIQVRIWVAGLNSDHTVYTSVVGGLLDWSNRQVPQPIIDLMSAKVQVLHGLNRTSVIEKIIKANSRSYGPSRDLSVLNNYRPESDPTPTINW
jgi:hypothetical protein